MNGDVEKVKKILEKKNSDPNIEDSSGYRAIHYACRNGHFEIVQALVEKGADIDAKTRSGQATPLHRAAMQGHTVIVRFLLSKGAKIEQVDADGMTSIHKACAANQIETVRELIGAASQSVLEIRDKRGRLAEDLTENEEIKQLFRK